MSIMRANITSSRSNSIRQSGFTIVELLIVVVIIAILAAISIVSYNSITTRAQTSTLTSNLSTAGSKLGLYQSDNNNYPANKAAFLSATGITESNGISYQYSPTPDSTLRTGYCITGTVNSIIYYISDTTGKPILGGCTGHVGGPAAVTITNLALNPSTETNINDWGSWAGNGGVAALSRQTTGGYSGSSFTRMTWSTATTTPSGGILSATPATAGTQYTSSMYVRSNKTREVVIEIKYLNSALNSIAYDGYTSFIVGPSTWTRINFTSTAPANTAYISADALLQSSGSETNWAVNDWLDVDALMINSGPTLSTYKDGNSAGWQWSGTINNSTSFGP